MKRGTKNPEITGLHIGKIVSGKMNEQRLSKAELSRKMGRNHQSIISLLLKKPSMQAYLLWEFSIAMNYDFFAHLSQELLRKHPAMSSPPLAALEKQLAELRQECDYLKRTIEILKK